MQLYTDVEGRLPAHADDDAVGALPRNEIL